MPKAVITLKCDKRGCHGVLRENVLDAGSIGEPPVERDAAGSYYIACPVCGSPYRLPHNGAHVLHTLVRQSSIARLLIE